MFSSALSLRPLRAVMCLLALGLALSLASVLPAAAQTPTVTALHSFAGSPSDGATPNAGVIQASDGNLYGTTLEGGANGDGTVFKITPAGKLTILHTFDRTDGYGPEGLVQASDGDLYGTTYEGGGAYNAGTVFKITTSGALTTLYSFTEGNDGGVPFNVTLVEGSDGNLYGTTYNAGAYGSGDNGGGTVFCITPSGALTTLHSFMGYGMEGSGSYPFAGVIQASDGNLYGTTLEGGANGSGTVFQITTSGTFTPLYSFSALDSQYHNSDGERPEAPLVQASDGNLYGTTEGGGANGCGTIFRITTSGVLTPLYDFNVPCAKYAGLIQASDGNLYGTILAGGANDDGFIFQITTSGTFTTLYSFSARHNSQNQNADGAWPYAGLIQASDGNLYGTTSIGGANGDGVVFRLNEIYVVPTLSGLNPGSIDAGSPSFTLTVKGSNFQPFSTVNWNGAPLTTTYVSATQLKATVPSSLIASLGKASVTVVTGAGGGTSNAKTFTIPLTTLKLASASLTQNSDGSYTANLTLKNAGYNTASNVTITKETLGTAATSTPLPLNIGSIAAGSSGNGTLSFPASAGSPGMVVTLKVSGTFTGGTFSGSEKVTLP